MQQGWVNVNMPTTLDLSSNIILMLADDMACDPRNPRPGTTVWSYLYTFPSGLLQQQSSTMLTNILMCMEMTWRLTIVAMR